MCQCIYCDEPITGEAGINYGGHRMHAACYVKFNDEMEAAYPDVEPPLDFDLLPELFEACLIGLGEPDEDDMRAWLSAVRGTEGFEDDHVEADLVGV